MEQYVPEFTEKDVDGQELLQMDGNKLKVRMRVKDVPFRRVKRNYVHLHKYTT